MRTTIDRVISVKEYKRGWYITTIEIDDGGERIKATHYGNQKDYWKAGDRVMVFLDDRFGRAKFLPDTTQNP